MREMLLFDFYGYVVYSLLLCFFTGLPLAIALRKNHEEEIGLIEIVFLSLIVGYFVPPMIVFVLNGFFNVLVSFQVSLLSRILVFLMPFLILSLELVRTEAENNKTRLNIKFNPSLVIIHYQKLLQDTKHSLETFVNDISRLDFSRLNVYISYFLFLVSSVIAFTILISRYSSVGFELDPYYYLYPMKNLIKLGYIPLTEDTAFYPDNLNKVVDSHRVGPLMNFAIYDLFILVYKQLKKTTDTIYDVSLAANIYPPLMHVFLVFSFFMLFKKIKVEIAGTVAAISAFLPRLLESLSPVEFQLEPIGVFGTIFILYAFTRFLSKNTLQALALLSIAISITLLGSKSAIMIHFPIIWTFLFILFIKSFALGSLDYKKELTELMVPFILYSLIYVIFFAVNISYMPNFDNPKNPTHNFLSLAKRILLDSDTLFIIVVLVYAALLYTLNELLIMKKLNITPSQALMAIYFIGLIFFIIEFGKFQELGRSLLGQFTYLRELERTIAEQNLSSDMIEPFFGFVGMSLKNNIFEFLFVVFNEFFNMILFLTITLMNIIFSLTVPLAVVTLSTNLLTFFYVVALFYLVVIIRPYLPSVNYLKYENFLFLLILIAMLTLVLVTLIKVKYNVYFAILFVLVFGIFMLFFYSVAEKVHLYLSKFLSLDEKKSQIAKQAIVLFSIVVIPLLQYSEVSSTPIAIHTSFVYSLKPKFSDNPLKFSDKVTKICTLTRDQNICRIAMLNNITIVNQHDTNICLFSQFEDVEGLLSQRLNVSSKVLYTASRRCSFISDGWLEVYEWMRENVPEHERITSWWDYGHWTNYFGERKTVLRNDHLSHDMILEIAHAYVMANESELVEIMKRYNSSYAIFDIEIAFGGSQFGGKYNALNYLACSRNNLTDYTKNVGVSECEELNRWDTLIIPENSRSCDISATENKKGISGILSTDSKSISVCIDPNNFDLYYLNLKDEFGDLKKIGMSRLFGGEEITNQQGFKMRLFSVGYFDDATRRELQTKHRFYDSNIYKAFVLEQMKELELVFKSNDGTVKVYKIKK
ncbi:MAG: hypothetical protein N3E37_04295 [Candidatus Micrarchaeota archaeon]|nr:hypothetical protein [Candidatus Micrarchaeota archaeon]